MIYDYLIIGAGIAGLSAARQIPVDKNVLIVCKKYPWECNTFFAQGGIASATDKDDIKSHINDTLKAGNYLNDELMVEKMSTESLQTIKDLVDDGMQFDLNENEKLAYTKEAAHSKSRILHADGDATGRGLHMFLLNSCQHSIMSNCIVIDLLYQDKVCYGVKLLQDKTEEKVIYAHNTIIATGGIGSIYKHHTNSTTISGDIHGICLEKKIPLKDMEFIQFHPTVYVDTPNARKTLLTEALRGEGAFIEDDDGRRFLFDYHCDGELAPRDVVSRAIFEYCKENNSKAYLSFENFKKKDFKKRFPNIYHNLMELGFDLPFERVPITPAFHYIMGGIDVDTHSKVKKTKNLYAIGEVSCTGVHGANRLASNSLLEGIVFAKIAIKHSVKNNFKIDIKNHTNSIKENVYQQPNDKYIKNELRTLMWEKVGIVRIRKDLKDALDTINGYLKKDIGRLLYLRLLTAKSIVESAIKRKKSIGAHFIKKEI